MPKIRLDRSRTRRILYQPSKLPRRRRYHIHLLIERHPTVAESQLAETLKTISSREIRKEFKEFLQPYYWKLVFWKRGYCAVSSGGASLDVLKKYIENQGYDN